MYVAVFPPSIVFTVIFVSPSDFGVTIPLESTVATAWLLLDHVTFLFAALDGDTSAVSVRVLFDFLFKKRVLFDEVIFTPLTFIFVSTCLTVILTCAVLAPSSVVAHIVAVAS